MSAERSRRMPHFRLYRADMETVGIEPTQRSRQGLVFECDPATARMLRDRLVATGNTSLHVVDAIARLDRALRDVGEEGGTG